VRVFTEVRRGADNDIAACSQNHWDQFLVVKSARTHTPSTPVSTATRASSMWHRM
jgi:hypothetical protein